MLNNHHLPLDFGPVSPGQKRDSHDAG